MDIVPLKSLARMCSGTMTCFFRWEGFVILPDLSTPLALSFSEAERFLNRPEIDTIFLGLDAMMSKYKDMSPLCHSADVR
jgi:hypothetical protein